MDKKPLYAYVFTCGHMTAFDPSGNTGRRLSDGCKQHCGAPVLPPEYTLIKMVRVE
jgi:hypothetical protein